MLSTQSTPLITARMSCCRWPRLSAYDAWELRIGRFAAALSAPNTTLKELPPVPTSSRWRMPPKLTDLAASSGAYQCFSSKRVALRRRPVHGMPFEMGGRQTQHIGNLHTEQSRQPCCAYMNCHAFLEQLLSHRPTGRAAGRTEQSYIAGNGKKQYGAEGKIIQGGDNTNE